MFLYEGSLRCRVFLRVPKDVAGQEGRHHKHRGFTPYHEGVYAGMQQPSALSGSSRVMLKLPLTRLLPSFEPTAFVTFFS